MPYSQATATKTITVQGPAPPMPDWLKYLIIGGLSLMLIAAATYLARKD